VTYAKIRKCKNRQKSNHDQLAKPQFELRDVLLYRTTSITSQKMYNRPDVRHVTILAILTNTMINVRLKTDTNGQFNLAHGAELK